MRDATGFGAARLFCDPCIRRSPHTRTSTGDECNPHASVADFRSTSLPAVSNGNAARIIEPRTGILRSLAHSANPLKVPVDQMRSRSRRQRIAGVTSRELMSMATQEAIEAAQAAVAASGIVPCIATTSACHSGGIVASRARTSPRANPSPRDAFADASYGPPPNATNR